MPDLNRQVIEEFRANGGRVGGMFEGAALLLLTTTGARSGRAHTTSAVYARARGPGCSSSRRTPVATEGGERDRLYAEQAGRDPGFAAYQAATDRIIPVVALHRMDDHFAHEEAPLGPVHRG
ncbi:nitroreductase family deazaflavin-dependent oxidoreductase [Streptomyces sp. SID6041]|nr:nitroreductase family deazaflavin-dependent oxidoreductase [Streptomyces sp. SID6041]